MKHVSLTLLALPLCMALTFPAQAADPARDQTQATQQDRERIYGSELMTQQERIEYQNRMRALKTEQEREAFRLEHHKLMQQRAQAQGKTLPDTPPAAPGGMGPGMGPGMGSGSGMGPGYRR